MKTKTTFILLVIVLLVLNCTKEDGNDMASLLISSTPSGAKITLDNILSNNVTPYEFEDISTGNHEIKLSFDGYKDSTFNVTIEKSQVYRVDIALKEILENEWIGLTSGTTNDLMEVYFTDNLTGWVVGNSGKILKTTNSGTTWIAQSSGTTSDLSSVYFIDNETGWAVGDGGIILKTTNGGTNWLSQTSGTTTDLVSVCFVTSEIGWAIGWLGVILKTINGGANWSSKSAGYLLYSGYYFDSNKGWVVGYTANQIPGSSKILKTLDGGSSYSTYSSGTSKYFFSIRFVDANNGWAVGDEGLVKNTTNGGTSWSTQTSGVTTTLMSVFFSDTNTGWAVGFQGTIINTSNGGSTWTTQVSNTSNTLYSVFVTGNASYAVGKYGTILKLIR